MAAARTQVAVVAVARRNTRPRRRPSQSVGQRLPVLTADGVSQAWRQLVPAGVAIVLLRLDADLIRQAVVARLPDANVGLA